jgi:hypothetical protein
MPSFFHEDDLPQRHPSEMSVMVNTMAIGDEEAFRSAFLAAHLSDAQTSGPSVLCTLWVDAPEEERETFGRGPIYLLQDEDDADTDADEIDATIEWTMVLTPQQARAIAYAFLRLADGLNSMIDSGDYGNRCVPDIPVYRSEPCL